MGAPEATPTVTPQATASSPSPPQPEKLPQDLQWVAEHYNPQQRAAELMAERGRSASVLSGASGLRSPGELFIVKYFSKRKNIFSKRKKTNSLTVSRHVRTARLAVIVLLRCLEQEYSRVQVD